MCESCGIPATLWSLSNLSLFALYILRSLSSFQSRLFITSYLHLNNTVEFQEDEQALPNCGAYSFIPVT